MSGAATLPLRGFPPGKIRLRMRPATFVEVYVKTDCAIHRYVAVEQDGYWVPGPELARNVFNPERKEVRDG